MEKKLPLIVLCLMMFTSTAHAGRFYAEHKENLIHFDDDNFDHESYFSHSLIAGYEVNKYLEFELEGMFGRFKTRRDTYSDGSSFSEIGFMLNTHICYPLNNRFKPYLMFGAGVDIFCAKELDSSETLNNKRSIMRKYGAGADWVINKDWSINMETGYKYSDTGDNSSIDTWGWIFSIGMKKYF